MKSVSNPVESRVELVDVLYPKALMTEARANPDLAITIQYVGNKEVGEVWKITRQSMRSERDENSGGD